MKRTTLILLLCGITMVLSAHTTIRLTDGWRFHAGDIADAAAVGLDDSQWQVVNLPHDFQISQPWVAPDASEHPDNNDPAANIKSRLSSRGFKEMGIGWYRFHLTPAESLKGQRLLLDFGGILYVGDVYLNGERIGGTDYGYVGFQIDITGMLRWGQDNVIAVRADTREPQNSRWYTGGGLFRDVKLIASNASLYFERYPLRITTRNNKYVNITAELTNRTKDRKVLLEVTILDPQGQTVAHDTMTVRRYTSSRTMEAPLRELAIANPQLWDCDHPALYRAVVTLRNSRGEVTDKTSSTFGIRTVEFGPAFGMKLNGQKVLLKGLAVHHSLGPLGAAAYPRALEKQLQTMKSYGINHVRTSHNPYSREFIELCDSLGILVVDELYDKWTRQHTGGRVPFEQLWQTDVPEWVKRDRNSPSVVLWSLGNELQQDPNMPYNDFGVTMYRLMRTLVHRYDTTRLTTVAMHPRYRNWLTDSLPSDLARITDIQSYNYRYMYFPGDSRRFPWMMFYQSEASMAAMGENYFAMDLDKVIGLAYWGVIDYLGESQGWPAKGWANGCFDITLDPKPKAYLMKSLFQPDKPVVHLAVIEKRGNQMWNGVQTGTDRMSDHWNRAAGDTLQMVTFTNADEVELIVNGHSMGTKHNNRSVAKERNQIRWTGIPYAAGYCEAIARTGGKVVARHRVETSGQAVRLVATPDNDAWHADGEDLQHIRVVAVDRKGRRDYTAQQELTFTVSDGATIVAVANGDITSNESYSGNKRHLYNGVATVILRATHQPSRPVLRVTAPGMKAVTVKLQTK